MTGRKCTSGSKTKKNDKCYWMMYILLLHFANVYTSATKTLFV